MRDQSPARLGPGIIAMLVVLAIAATVMAYLVTSRILERRSAGAANSTATSPAAAATTSASPDIPTPTAPSPSPAGPTEPTLGPDRSRPGDGQSCPDPTVEALAAAGLNAELALRIYVEFTVPRGEARAWICQNADGVLVYQAHERIGPFDRAFNARNTLLLAEGIRGAVAETVDGFRAVNEDAEGGVTEYVITDTVVRITTPRGNVINAPVTFVFVPG